MTQSSADKAPSKMNTSIFAQAVKQGFGGAGIALASSFFALGVLLGESGLSAMQAAFFSVAVFALPGQLAAAELLADGAGLTVIVAAVWLVNLRLLPMTIVLMPLLRPAAQRGWRDFAAAHLVAVTCWVCFMNSYRTVPPPSRYGYFAVMGAIFWLGGTVATVAGCVIGGVLPPWLLVGLLFLNPIYFLCLMLSSLANRADAAAMALGTLLLLLLPDKVGQWDIVIAGVVGGGMVFAVAEGRKGGVKDR